MESIGRSASALSSAAESSDANVVALVRGDEVYCTGTLVARTAVVTAAHCVEDGPIVVAFGTTIDASSRHVKARRVIAHPSYDSATLAHDVAIVALAEGTDGPFVSIDRTTPLVIGETLRSVGYGRTGPDTKDGGRQRAGSTTVFATEGDHVELRPGPAMLCAGDSGGPTFDASGALVAVTSYGEESCRVNAFATRVDAERTFLRDALSQVAADDAASSDDGGCSTTGAARGDALTAIAFAFVVVAISRRARPRTTPGPSGTALR